jgi:hypothetical protein
MTTPSKTTTAAQILSSIVSTGTFYARIKYKGKTIPASLNTKALTVARERLPDKIKQLNYQSIIR